jgi:hypothetical protein
MSGQEIAGLIGELGTVLTVSGGTAFNQDWWDGITMMVRPETGWLALGERYGDLAARGKEEIYRLSGVDIDQLTLGGYDDELRTEQIKARAVLAYWEEELEVARAVDEYAQRNDSGLEAAGETLEALEAAEGEYEAALVAYWDSVQVLEGKKQGIDGAQDGLKAAEEELSGKSKAVEAARTKYAQTVALIKGMSADMLEVELGDLATVLQDSIWEGKVTGSETTLRELIAGYLEASDAYGEVQNAQAIGLYPVR